MAEITAAMVKDLREKTGVGMMDCKSALAATNGDMEAAVDWLRAKGLAKAAKKSTRVAAEGLVAVAVEGTTGALVEVNSETDFVARTEEFQQLARDLAMHVTASRPLFVSRDEVPAELIAKEKEVYAEQMVNSGKPAQVIEKIVEGKLDKWYSEVCLLEQAFVKDPDVTIQALLTDRIASLGENIKVRRFSRFEVGAAE